MNDSLKTFCKFVKVKDFKSIFSIVLLVSFLSSIMGVQIYKHYCGSFLEGISLYVPSNVCEGEDGEMTCSSEKETSCCDDELEVHQLKIDFRKTQKQELKRVSPILIAIIFPNLLEDQLISSFEDYNVRVYIPDIPIYKKLNRYTLYA